MDTEKKFNCRIELTLIPIGKIPPSTMLGIDDQIILTQDLVVPEEKLIIDKSLSYGNHCLQLFFLNKPDNDIDQAVKIKELRLNGIQDPKFIWSGIYRPNYPEPWAAQQKNSGKELSVELSNTDYLGWNGVWTLNFTSPIFTWIHRMQDLGWIYD